MAKSETPRTFFIHTSGHSMAENAREQKRVDKTIGLVNKSLQIILPAEFHSRMNLDPRQLDFSKTKEQLIKMENDLNNSNPRHLHDGLIGIGLPPQTVDPIFSNIDRETMFPTLWMPQNNVKSKIYVANNNLSDLASEYNQKESNAAIELGSRLIQDLFERLPTPLEIPQTEILKVYRLKRK